MEIEFIKTLSTAAGLYRKGRTYYIEDEQAQRYIALGLARPNENEPVLQYRRMYDPSDSEKMIDKPAAVKKTPKKKPQTEGGK